MDLRLHSASRKLKSHPHEKLRFEPCLGGGDSLCSCSFRATKKDKELSTVMKDY